MDGVTGLKHDPPERRPGNGIFSACFSRGKSNVDIPVVGMSDRAQAQFRLGLAHPALTFIHFGNIVPLCGSNGTG